MRKALFSARTNAGGGAAGFTLVELTLCIAIVAILAAIAMPRYARAIASYRARAAAQRVAYDLAQVQSYARTSSACQTISFNASNSTYQIGNLRDLDRASNAYSVSLDSEPYKASIATLSLGGSSQIVFDGYGNPDRGGSITLQSGTRTRTVIIDATTGRVTVQ